MGLSTTTPVDQLALLRQLVKPSTLLTDEQRRAVPGVSIRVRATAVVPWLCAESGLFTGRLAGRWAGLSARSWPVLHKAR
jgi:hypothetical protein